MRRIAVLNGPADAAQSNVHIYTPEMGIVNCPEDDVLIYVPEIFVLLLEFVNPVLPTIPLEFCTAFQLKCQTKYGMVIVPLLTVNPLPTCTTPRVDVVASGPVMEVALIAPVTVTPVLVVASFVAPPYCKFTPAVPFSDSALEATDVVSVGFKVPAESL